MAAVTSATAPSSVCRAPVVVGAQLVLGMAQRQTDRDQALLCAVVQVAFDAAAFLVRDGGYPGAGGLHVFKAMAQLDPEAGHVDRHACGSDDARRASRAVGRCAGATPPGRG